MSCISKEYIYLNMVKTGTNNLASYVYLELLKFILLLLSVDSTIVILYLEMFPT